MGSRRQHGAISGNGPALGARAHVGELSNAYRRDYWSMMDSSRAIEPCEGDIDEWEDLRIAPSVCAVIVKMLILGRCS